jgi:hypothetical protein
LEGNALLSKKEIIATELDRIPEEMLDEVLDFVRFLGAKAVIRAGEPALLSQAALAEAGSNPKRTRPGVICEG